MTNEVFFFRLGFLFEISVFALPFDESVDAYIGFCFFFLRSLGLLYLFTICWIVFFFRLGLLYHLLFRIDVGLFCGLALLQFFFFFFRF